MASPSPSHTIAPTTLHTHTVIFLHGRGSDAQTFASELFESQDSSSAFFTDLVPSLKWVFPLAPKSYSTSEKEELHQWFDMSSVQRPQENPDVQREGLWNNVAHILQIVGDEAEMVGTENVILAGISQGCATAIFTLLASGLHVGGFVGLCGWLPLAEEIVGLMDVPERFKDVLKMPIMLQHCRDDAVVPVRNGEALRDELKKMGMRVEWEEFEEGGHWLNEPEGMDGIVRFIKEVMQATQGFGNPVESSETPTKSHLG
jgi:lysophospholipase-2